MWNVVPKMQDETIRDLQRSDVHKQKEIVVYFYGYPLITQSQENE